MATGTVALVVANEQEKPVLLEVFSDDSEISLLEKAIGDGHTDPVRLIYENRVKVEKEEEEFGDYVEELVTNPGANPGLVEHGVQWLRSKMKIEDYRKSEVEASQVIADYAFKLFEREPERRDFMLAGPSAEVRIKIFLLQEGQAALTPSEAA